MDNEHYKLCAEGKAESLSHKVNIGATLTLIRNQWEIKKRAEVAKR